MLDRRLVLKLSAATAALGSFPLSVFAQGAYPNKNVRLIIPFAPGGPTDLVGRLVAQALTDEWKQQVIPENRAGASGVTGSQVVQRSAPDGYNLVLGNSASHAAYELLNPKSPPYDGLKDFAAVAMLCSEPLIIMVRKDLGVTNVKDFIAYAKANPGKMKFGTAAIGSSAHLAWEGLLLATGAKGVNVPFTGAAPVAQAVLAGDIDANMTGVSNMAGMVDSGRAIALAAVSPERVKAAPKLPTLREEGIDVAFESWYGLFAPAGTPEAILTKINADVNRLLDTPETAKKLENLGFDMKLRSRAEFIKTMQDYRTTIARIIKVARMEVQ